MTKIAIQITDPRYPKALARIDNPPEVLYAAGNVGLLENPVIIGIVGSRDVNEYIKRVTREWAYSLSRAGAVIISGCAKGVSAYAHQGAEQYGSICVLPYGFDYVDKTQMQLSEKSLLITEVPPEYSAQKWTLNRANRIISAISDGVLIMAAGENSGALITADYAIKQGKKIMCAPPVNVLEGSEGIKQLLYNGAKLVMSPKDVLKDYSVKKEYNIDINTFNSVKRELPKGLSQEQSLVYKHITLEPMAINELAEKTQIPINNLMNILTMLELDGLVASVSGQRIKLAQ